MRIAQVKLKEITSKITKGTTPTTLGLRFTERGINFIKAESITPEGRIDESKFAFIDDETNEKLNRSKIEEGDILFSIAGMKLGKVAVVKKEHLPANTNQALAIIRVDRSKALPEYILYWFLNPSYYKYVNSITAQAAQPNINLTQVGDLPIGLPDLPIQRRVVAILSAYDDLIENNLRRIKILEEMAQSIYREWFVKFRFPGHQKVKMVDSPLGKIPEGWEITQIGDVIETLGGGTPSTKEPSYWDNGNIDWYSPSDLTASGSMFINGSSKRITQLGLEKSSAKLFPAYSLMMTSRATIGVISINTKEACTNQGFITCVPSDRLSVFHLYFWVKENREKIISVASGATFKEISRGEFREFSILVPPSSIEETFTDTVEPICRLIENLIKKSHNLRKTRDLLLPKLISGELDVSELDITIPETERN